MRAVVVLTRLVLRILDPQEEKAAASTMVSYVASYLYLDELSARCPARPWG